MYHETVHCVINSNTTVFIFYRLQSIFGRIVQNSSRSGIITGKGGGGGGGWEELVVVGGVGGSGRSWW